MKWYTVKEAAERLKVTEKTMAKWLRDSRFPHAEKNGKWRVPECCLEGHKEAAVEEAKPDPELEKLRQEKSRLLVEKEVKELKAELAGIFAPADQDKIAKAQEKLLMDSAKLAEREQGLVAEMAEREQELAGREDKVTAAQDELTAAYEALKVDKDEWKEILTTAQSDLKLIHEYYKKVCGQWHIKEDIMLPLLGLNPNFYTQSFGAELGDDELKDDEDEEPER